MTRSILFKSFCVAVTVCSLTACDGSSDSQKSNVDLSQFVGRDNAPQAQPQNTNPTNNSDPNAPQPTIIQSQTPVEQSGQPSLPEPNRAKIYTYQGNVLLPPEAYMDKQSGEIDKLDICGHQTLSQNINQQFCYKFSELMTRLYDRDHAGLDVWDVRGDYYLVLTKAQDKSQAPQELWIAKNKFGVYHPYADIMQQKLLFLGDWNYQVQPQWPLQAYDGPDGTVIEIKKDDYPAQKSSSPMVAITSVAQSGKKELWFKLNLINSLCETSFLPQNNNAAPSPVVTNLWFPAYRLEGNLRIPTVWFYAKGC